MLLDGAPVAAWRSRDLRHMQTDLAYRNHPVWRMVRLVARATANLASASPGPAAADSLQRLRGNVMDLAADVACGLCATQAAERAGCFRAAVGASVRLMAQVQLAEDMGGLGAKTAEGLLEALRVPAEEIRRLAALGGEVRSPAPARQAATVVTTQRLIRMPDGSMAAADATAVLERRLKRLCARGHVSGAKGE